MTEREEEKSYWLQTAFVWWELFCVTDSVILTLKPYSTMNLPWFFFIILNFVVFVSSVTVLYWISSNNTVL